MKEKKQVLLSRSLELARAESFLVSMAMGIPPLLHPTSRPTRFLSIPIGSKESQRYVDGLVE
jgi:hypothetical protein